MTEACVTGEARRATLERRRSELSERQKRLHRQLDENAEQCRALEAATVPQAVLDAAAAQIVAAVAAVETARAAAAGAVDRLSAVRTTETQAVDAAREAERNLARLKAEADALTSILSPSSSPARCDRPPVLSMLDVPPGLEAAIAALFDGELTAPLLDQPSDGATGWVVLPPLAEAGALPEQAEPLAARIAAPAALARHLGLAGLVSGAAEGWGLQPFLAPGQSLVDRDGHLWRWDGFVRAASGTGGAAEQLRQRNRLTALAGQIAEAESQTQALTAAAGTARNQAAEAAGAEREAAAALRHSEEVLARRRTEESELTRRALGAETRSTALAETTEKLGAELTEIDAQAVETERNLALTPDPGLARTALDGARIQAAAARRHESEAQAALARLAQESESRRRRFEAITAESQSWRQRRERALAQREALGERQAALAAEIAELDARPAKIADERQALGAQIERATATRRAVGDALALAETRLRAAGDNARQAEHALAQAREERVRCEVRRESAATALSRLREEIRDRLETLPEALAELVAGEDDTTDPVQLDVRLDRLTREREAIGPVNLVAEREAEEVETRIASLQHERAELTEAIARLRRGIAALDQEGRKRLEAAFATLDKHFATLFQRLFGGGRAHLALTDAEDPLDAGLEIMASPPGKRLQALSLLSGGEQALTAIALIFAVFLTNPAPICVLDEVDAPLDDANVDRFCQLVAEIADTTGTKFLVITHHRITMAQMDRLFGVTMPERGISQLVSVDLTRAAELRAPAYAAAQ
jgi:chromosome segregation protein